jgi:hypothetical protein
MNTSEWKSFLAEYNRELMSYEEVVEVLPKEVISHGWLGYAGASDAEIRTAEKRLATQLPPSYRAFLSASNGWRYPSVSIGDLWPVQKVAWFREHNQDWIDIYTAPSAKLPPLTDEEYLVYGAEQDCVKLREEYLQNALQISPEGDSAVVLLNPRIVTAEGEWETWFFANWLPGAMRYRSFAEWLADERKNCVEHLKPIPKAKVAEYVTARKPVSVKKAQAAARSGQTEIALESLEHFAGKGDDSAAASLAELYAFLGQWDKVIFNAGRLIANPGAVYAGNVFDAMIRLLGRAGHRSGDWPRVTEVVERAVKANADRFAGLRRNAKDKIKRDIYDNSERRNNRILENLIDYAKRQGKPPHELLAIFGIRGCMDDMNAEQRKAWYDNAVKNAETLRPDLKKNPQAKWEYFFSLSQDVSENQAVSLYEEHGKTFGMAWQAAEYVAPIYVRRGNLAAAWRTVETNLKNWWPVDHAQVAPLVLLTNEHLETLMSPERCLQVLSTPRGPEGAQAAQ